MKLALPGWESGNGLLKDIFVEFAKLVVRGEQVDDRLLQLPGRRVFDRIGIHDWRMRGLAKLESAKGLYCHRH